MRTDWKWALSAQLCVIWKHITVTERCDFERKQSSVTTNLKQHIPAFFFLGEEICYTHVQILRIGELILTFLSKRPGLENITQRNAGLC